MLAMQRENCWNDTKRSSISINRDQSIAFCFGEKYVGEWKDDVRNGNGTFTDDNGRKYVGQWKNDKKHGDGTFTWANG